MVRLSGDPDADLPVKVVFGADDEGPTVDAVRDELRERGIQVEDIGGGDWPDVARLVGEAVSRGDADMGVVMCWTGTGTSMMANKVHGVRAALCWDPWIAEGARRYNDANVLVLSLKRTSPDTAREIIGAWLSVDAPDPGEAANIARLSEYESKLS